MEVETKRYFSLLYISVCAHHFFGLNQDIGIVLLVIFPVNGQKLFVPEI